MQPANLFRAIGALVDLPPIFRVCKLGSLQTGTGRNYKVDACHAGSIQYVNSQAIIACLLH